MRVTREGVEAVTRAWRMRSSGLGLRRLSIVAVSVAALVAGGGAGGRVATASPRSCTIEGTPGDDVLVGTTGDDVICGFGGNDVIRAKGGDDEIYGGPGRDRIFGGPGHDLIRAGPE